MSQPPELRTEEELVQLFRETGDAFRPDRQLMVLGAVAHGRRLRRRRTGAAVGGALALALVAFGGAVAGDFTVSGRAPAQPALTVSSDSSPSPRSTAPGLTDEEMVAALTARLPGFKVVGSRGIGTVSAVDGGDARPLAELTLNDGAERFVVTVALQRMPVMSLKDLLLAAMPCDSPQDGAAVKCSTSPVGDHALLQVRQPIPTAHSVGWSCLLLSEDGKRVSVTEWPAAGAPPVSVAKPTLSLGRLREIALDPVWDRAMTGIPVVGRPVG
ncbi:hypothetical protein [Kitasatospora paranensis]|uniref:Uncharacterized protein n=1 Tax=Kitasatospora paranensis TaxID=258053 RepID=A0ABW2FTJ2_9ACTN